MRVGGQWQAAVARSAVIVSVVFLAACQSAAPASPTSAPAKPSTAPGTAATTAPAAPSAQPSAAPAVAPAASPSPAAKPSAAASPSPAAATATFNEQAVATFYSGKTVRFIVGLPAGGGYDTYARLMARYLPKYIPGSPTVIVENMPGAGSKIAYSQIANNLPKDGTVMGIADGSLVETYILNPSEFDFDFGKLQYLGAPGQLQYVLVITKAASDRTGVTKFEDILGPNGKQLVTGTVGPGVENITQQLLANVLGANLKIVTGYPGTAQERLAMDNGELDGYVNSWDSVRTTNDDDIRAGRQIILARLTDSPLPTLPEVAANTPNWLDFAKTDEDKQLLRAGSIRPQQLARATFVASGVPADRVAALQSAFTKTMADPSLVADAAQAKLDINPLTGAQLQDLITQYLATPDATKSRLKQILKL